MPNQMEDYIHRIGRTGRAGATGTAYSFFTAGNMKLAREFVEILKESGADVPPQLEMMSGRGGFGGGNSRYRGGGGGGGGG
eukprot:CAMPEP_0114550086 /NCGR_PEP_ID=MMETSP0114-20121206/5883_1 /TAXON_ID=31324 /ORGANISM="Goniomonas sp, Strain m" /LENGTH=80 /DNA_ID=CAMNT_0001734831 /DNA_START=389 /DNA_END=627 /DNA_ORIENTATION=+